MATEDFVGGIERLIEESGQAAVNLTKSLVRDVFYRPIFSQKVPKEEQMLQYEFIKDDEEALLQFFTDQKASVPSAIKYVKEMERQRNQP